MTRMTAPLADEEATLLDGWIDFVGKLSVTAADVGSDRIADTSGRLLKLVDELGWLELPLAEGISTSFLCDAMYEIHKVVVPVPVPLAELWIAQMIERALGAPPRRSSIGLSDLMRPARAAKELRTSWVPIAGAETILMLTSDSNRVEVRMSHTSRLSAESGVGLDISLPTKIYQGPDSAWDIAGILTDGDLNYFQVRALCLQSSALVGQARVLLDTTIDYLKTREQFGVKIGSFQALKHRVAELHADLYAGERLARFAAWAADHRSDSKIFANMAKSVCANTAIRVAHEAVQLHGGVGFTWDGAIHFGVRRCAYMALTGSNPEECSEVVGSQLLTASRVLWAGDA